MKKTCFLTMIIFIMLSLFITGCNKTDANGDNTTKDDKTTTIDDSTTTVMKRMVVTYYEDEETMISRKNYTNSNFELLVPEKEGYTFNGWFLDSSLENPFNQNNLSEYFEIGKLSLYASWTLIGDNYTIELKGEIENKTVINPAFIWDNPYGDSSFNVKILNGNAEVKNVDVSECFYASNLLDYSTTYKFVVEGKETHNTSEVEFTTITNSNYNTNNSIVLNDPFMNNMVMQRDNVINLSGNGPENVLISVRFGNELYFGLSGSDGKFDVEIASHRASFDPIDVTVGLGLAKNVTITNVLIGDVYFFTGQSNMQWPAASSDCEYEDMMDAIDCNVRLFTQGVVTSKVPLDHVTSGKWFSVDTKNYEQYSAIGFMCGAMLGKQLKNRGVPIGILSAYQGDTNIANWMNSDYYTGSCGTKYLHYNAMVYPLLHTKIKGVVWYQGCNNSAAGGDYEELLLAYFQNYRDIFDDENLPFYVIGLACYDGDSGNNYDFSYVRESQAKACAQDDRAFYISSCDDGDPTFIHPEHKRYIALRVTKSILSSLYSFNYLSEGPSYKSHTVSGNVVTIELNNSEGLYSKGEITNLYLAASDGKYYTATARIENGKIIASSTKVSNPVYIKYGFGKSPFVNIFNVDDYSLVPFRTDDHNTNIDLLDYNSTSLYTFHPDGSSMEYSLNDSGLNIKKANDGKTYGSVRLNKWGMIAYEPQGFRFTVTGTNSGAKITFRAIEGPSYETWGYSIIDNFTTEKTFEISISDFIPVYNKKDSIFDTQAISYIEIMVEANGASEFTVSEARFIEMARTKPKDFIIGGVSLENNGATISLNKSLFAESYTVLISESSTDFSNPIYNETGDKTAFKVDTTNYEIGKPYYIRAIATNDLGSTTCLNDAYIFYIKDPNSLILNNWDYETQSALDSFIASNMKVHEGLNCILQEDHSLKIESTGAGWQNFIFVIESGSNSGMNKLVFDADFSNYKGTVVLEIVGTNWEIFQYNLDLTTQNKGTFTLNLSDYISKNTHKGFEGEALMWVSFNFSDNQGNGYILFDDCKLAK